MMNFQSGSESSKPWKLQKQVGYDVRSGTELEITKEKNIKPGLPHGLLGIKYSTKAALPFIDELNKCGEKG